MCFNNETVPMTRRYPNLKQKVLLRDSKIAERIIKAWDIEQDDEKVLQIFLKEQKNLSDERYWELMRTVWIVAGSLDTVDIFRQLMSSTRPFRYYFSTPEESKALRYMDDTLYVYRATDCENPDDDKGISWTLSLDYAKWYKERYNKKYIISQLIDKDRIFAYINRNKEEEVLIL